MSIRISIKDKQIKVDIILYIYIYYVELNKESNLRGLSITFKSPYMPDGHNDITSSDCSYTICTNVDIDNYESISDMNVFYYSSKIQYGRQNSKYLEIA